ncbi:PAS domain-containing sensor histidine kinase [Maribacter sp. CXY002]|uniref:sensor histidine kinase n=1 Tax=Maribacter luteocoastalis TaxID=3407671 RepID=UPI003B671850
MEKNEDENRSKLRSRAEKEVKKNLNSKLDLTLDKARLLMHELEVHQTELEMQNQELREVQHRLEESHDEYTNLFDFAPVGYLVLNEKGVIENINLTACTLMGVDRLRILDKPFSAFMSIGESKTLFLKLREAFDIGFIKPFELVIKKNRYDTFTALAHITITKKNGNNPVCLLALQDITEIREAEAIQQHHKNLQLEKEKIQQYLELAPVIFLLLDNEYKVQLINKKGCDLLGFGKNEIEGNPWFDYFTTTNHEQENLEEKGYFKKKRVLASPYFESNVRCKNGEIRLIGWTNTTLHDNNGKNIGTLSAGEDITERKKMEASMQKYTDLLEQTVEKRTQELSNALEAEQRINEIKSSFISIASHELRTPITIVMSSIILLEKYNQKGLYDKEPKHIARIKTSVNHFTNILNDFLSLDQLERGDVRIHREKFDFAAFINEIITELEVLQKTGQQISYANRRPQYIVQDRKILHHIILNLLSNALKYSDKTVNISSVLQANGLKVVISDYGMGIPKEDLDYIFTRFFRSKNVENIQGTGLGLSIVKRYLELLGGTISCTSELNVGTTFTMIIPTE